MNVPDEEEATKEELYVALWTVLMRGIDRGGLSDKKRADLAQRYGVREAVLLRYERAGIAYHAAIFDRIRSRSRVEATRRLCVLGKEELWGTSEWFHDMRTIREGLWKLEEPPEPAFILECKLAHYALRAALGLHPWCFLPPEEPTAKPKDDP